MRTITNEMLKGFIEAVKEMRKYQKEYFRTREKGWLDASKKAERKVDGMLYQLENPTLI